MAVSPLLERLVGLRVVAAIRADSASLAVAVGHALARGGLAGYSVTFSIPGAPAALAALRRDFPNALVGAGMVCTPDGCAAARAAGADFVMSPHLYPAVVSAAREGSIPLIVGAMTPTEIFEAWEAGATCVSLFPASTLGPAYLSAVRGPFSHIPLLPSGDITLPSLGEWLRAGAIAVEMDDGLTASDANEVEAKARGMALALRELRSPPETTLGPGGAREHG